MVWRDPGAGVQPDPDLVVLIPFLSLLDLRLCLANWYLLKNLGQSSYRV